MSLPTHNTHVHQHPHNVSRTHTLFDGPQTPKRPRARDGEDFGRMWEEPEVLFRDTEMLCGTQGPLHQTHLRHVRRFIWTGVTPSTLEEFRTSFEPVVVKYLLCRFHFTVTIFQSLVGYLTFRSRSGCPKSVNDQSRHVLSFLEHQIHYSLNSQLYFDVRVMSPPSYVGGP